jgi:hypothetical protein
VAFCVDAPLPPDPSVHDEQLRAANARGPMGLGAVQAYFTIEITPRW